MELLVVSGYTFSLNLGYCVLSNGTQRRTYTIDWNIKINYFLETNGGLTIIASQ